MTTAKNFKNQDLTGQNFDNQDLSYSLFRGANLTNCSFVNAKLHGINLRETTIENCNFTNAEMYLCNTRDAVGTANWTNTKVYGVPEWIPMSGADATTLPIGSIKKFYLEAIAQAGLTFQDLTAADQKAIYMTGGHGGPANAPQRFFITGSYGNVPHGRRLYEMIGDPDGVNQISLERVLNLCISLKIKFNVKKQEFFKKNK